MLYSHTKCVVQWQTKNFKFKWKLNLTRMHSVKWRIPNRKKPSQPQHCSCRCTDDISDKDGYEKMKDGKRYFALIYTAIESGWHMWTRTTQLDIQRASKRPQLRLLARTKFSLQLFSPQKHSSSNKKGGLYSKELQHYVLLKTRKK